MLGQTFILQIIRKYLKNIRLNTYYEMGITDSPHP